MTSLLASWANLSNTVKTIIASQSSQRLGDDVRTAIFAINWADLPEAIKAYIVAHPYSTAFYVANGVVFFAPALMTGPLLALAGFGASGPVAGSLAAMIQSASGAVQAGGCFATLQSAAMGGYGAATLGTIVQVGSFVSAVATRPWKL